MPLFIFPIITILAYLFVGGNIWFNKPLAAKSFSNLAVMCNLIVLAVIFAFLKRVPLGGFLETSAEMALILGVIYTFFIPVDLKRLSLTIIGICAALMVIALFGGLKLQEQLAVYISWWLQLSIQAHLLANGFLLFSLICLFTVIFDKDKTHAEEIAGFAHKGVLFTQLVLVLGLLCTMMWNFVSAGEMLLWNKALMLNLMFITVLLLPLVSRQTWFKELRHKLMFDAMVITLVFLINLTEWGGLA